MEGLDTIRKLQIVLNEFITPSWLLKRSENDWITASISELQEAIDTQHWKWWKGSDKREDRLFLELIDVLHFTISGETQNAGKERGIHIGICDEFREFDMFIPNDVPINEHDRYIIELVNKEPSPAGILFSQILKKTLFMTSGLKDRGLKSLPDATRSIIDNFAKGMVKLVEIKKPESMVGFLHHLMSLVLVGNFTKVTSLIVEFATDEKFPIVPAYFAKHVLNYIRQLGGYKTGDYSKPANEDATLLEGAALYIPELDLQMNFDLIATFLFDTYKVPNETRKFFADWLPTESRGD